MPPRSRAARRISALSSTRRARVPCRRRAPPRCAPRCRRRCAGSGCSSMPTMPRSKRPLTAAPLDILQFHGSESPERVAAVKARFGRPVMKAIPIAAAEDVAAASRYEDCADLLLFDAKPPRRDDALARRQRPRVRLASDRRARVAPAVDAVGRADRRAAARGGADFRRDARSMCPPASSAAPATRTRRKSANFCRRPRFDTQDTEHGESNLVLSVSRGAFRRHDADTEHLSRRAGPARPFRHLWRALCRRDADAADPGRRAGLQRGQGRPELPRRAGLLPRPLCRPAEPALFRRAADPAFRRRQALFQTRRAEPHRRAQDQQRARPDPAGAPHGQAPHHRRDRRRPARRRDRDRLRAVRPALRRLHGRHRHRAAEAERLPHAAARRRGRAGAFRHRDLEGRDERRAARLGRACRRHVLRDRHGRGAAPLPGDGARLPVGDRPRDARADHEGRGAAARHAGRLHRRRLERDGAVPPVSRRSGGRG